jgi:hypothetical protein
VPVLEEEFVKLLGCLTFTTTTEAIWKVNDIEPGTDNATQSDSVFGENRHDIGIPGYHERMLPPSFSREFQQVARHRIRTTIICHDFIISHSKLC